jgi:hypothetical protein
MRKRRRKFLYKGGLAIAEAVGRLDTIAGPSGTLSARIGIATGFALVGDLIGSGASLEWVVGEAANLANRLQQSVAKSGMVVLDDVTRRLVGSLFEYRNLGAHVLKGFGAPVQAWAVLAEGIVDSRYEALHSGQIPLVGRTEELEMLLRRWEQVRTGEGRVVLLSGEAGVGKSRLIAAFEQKIDGGRTRSSVGFALRCFKIPTCTPSFARSSALQRSWATIPQR